MNFPEPLIAERKFSDCCSPACRNTAQHGRMFCEACSKNIQQEIQRIKPAQPINANPPKITGVTPTKTVTDEFHDKRSTDPKMSFKYPKYYKEIPSGVTEVDIYMVCHLFQVNDYTGALHHAIKKILLPGVRTGGKTRRDDIKEARDTLTRWLEIHK